MTITVQALQANGTWGVRSAFTTENAKVRAGSMTAADLEYLARAMQELSVGHPQEKAALPLIQAAVQTLRKSARDHDSGDYSPHIRAS